MPIKVLCDASPYGIGVHILPSGEECPIAFASRTLSKAEQNYAQIDREALSLIFGVKRFHNYLYGRRFILQSDHKSLNWIFGEKKGIPVMAPARILRWTLFLAGYDYSIEDIKDEQNVLADSLSRLPLKLPTNPEDEVEEKIVSMFNLSQIECLPVKSDH